MKKLTIIAIALVAIATSFISCKKDSTTSPVITFANIADSATSLTVTGSSYGLTFTVTSDAGLSKVVISETRGGTTSTTQTITSFDNNNSYTQLYNVTNISTSVTVIISATDKNDLNTSRQLVITKQGNAAGPINTYTAVLLGSNNNTSAGSYLATSTGTVYHAADKQTQSSVIDIIYGTTTDNVDEFFSPDLAISGITGGNATTFATSSINFDNVTDDALLQSITASNKELSGFSVGSVIQFVTQAGKKGIFKVTAYTSGDSGSVTINVKVQQ